MTLGGRLCGTLFRRVATWAGDAFTSDETGPKTAGQRRIALVLAEQRDTGRELTYTAGACLGTVACRLRMESPFKAIL